MTKAELIEALKSFNDDDVVSFQYPSGNYWKDVVIKPITEVELSTAKYSDYNENWVLASEEDVETDGNFLVTIVLR